MRLGEMRLDERQPDETRDEEMWVEEMWGGETWAPIDHTPPPARNPATANPQPQARSRDLAPAAFRPEVCVLGLRGVHCVLPARRGCFLSRTGRVHVGCRHVGFLRAGFSCAAGETAHQPGEGCSGDCGQARKGRDRDPRVQGAREQGQKQGVVRGDRGKPPPLGPEDRPGA